MKTKIISISNHKGGVGKTTTTVNLGAALAQRGHKVLLLDLDAQANLSQYVGIALQTPTIADALEGKARLEPIEITKNLYAVPSELRLAVVAETLINQPASDHILKDLLDKLNTTEKYSFVLIDCPPSLNKLTINAFVSANLVYIPLQAEYLALQGLGALLEVVNLVKTRINKGLQIGGVIVTQYDQRRILNKEVTQAIEQLLPGKVFKSKIRPNIALAEAPTRGLDVLRYSASSNGAKDYKALANEILKTK